MAELIPLPSRPVREPEPLWRDALGDVLRRLRHDRGERLTDTARRAGVSPQYLSEVERGLKEPSSEMIAAVAGIGSASRPGCTPSPPDPASPGRCHGRSLAWAG